MRPRRMKKWLRQSRLRQMDGRNRAAEMPLDAPAWRVADNQAQLDNRTTAARAEKRGAPRQGGVTDQTRSCRA